MRLIFVFFAVVATTAAIKCYTTGGEQRKVPSAAEAFECPSGVISCLSASYNGRISGFQRNTVAFTCDFQHGCKRDGCFNVKDGELTQTTCCCSSDLCNKYP